MENQIEKLQQAKEIIAQMDDDCSTALNKAEHATPEFKKLQRTSNNLWSIINQINELEETLTETKNQNT